MPVSADTRLMLFLGDSSMIVRTFSMLLEDRTVRGWAQTLSMRDPVSLNFLYKALIVLLEGAFQVRYFFLNARLHSLTLLDKMNVSVRKMR